MPALPPGYRRNAVTNYVNSIVALVLALVVTPLLARGLGKDAYGTWVLVGSSVVYLNLLQLGFRTATTRYVAEGLARRDRVAIARALSTSVAALSIPGIVLLLAAPGLAFLVPLAFHIPRQLHDAAIVVALLSAIDLAIAVPVDTFGAAIAGAQRYDLLNMTLSGTAIAQAVAWAIVILLGGGIVPLAIASVALSLASQVARYAIVRRLLGADAVARRRVDRSLVKPLLSMSGWIAITDFAETVIGRVDPIVVGLVVGVPQAGVYAVGQKLSGLVTRFTEPVVTLFFPHATAMAATGDREGLRRAFLTGTRIAVAIAMPLTIGLIVLAHSLLRLWVGRGFGEADVVVVCLAATAAVWAVSGAGVYVLRGMGDVRRPALIDSFEALVNLGLSIALGLLIGLHGVAIATLIAAVATRLGIMVPYVCRRTGTSVGAFALGLIRTVAPPSLAALAVGFALRSAGPSRLATIALTALAMAVGYTVVLAGVGLSSSERGTLRASLRAWRPARVRSSADARTQRPS
jgi:O-antigen/teichoic acid export membrane protein